MNITRLSIVLLSLLLLSNCTDKLNETEISGKWYLNKIEKDGMEIRQKLELDCDAFILNENHTYTTIKNKREIDGGWIIRDSTLIMKDSPKSKTVREKLTLQFLSSDNMIFESEGLVFHFGRMCDAK